MSRVQRPEIALGTGWCLQKRCWPAHYSDFDATMLHMELWKNLCWTKCPWNTPSDRLLIDPAILQIDTFVGSSVPPNVDVEIILGPTHHFLTPSSFLPPCPPITCPESDEVWGREPERIIGPKSAKFLHKHCKIIAANSRFKLYTWSDGEYRA